MGGALVTIQNSGAQATTKFYGFQYSFFKHRHSNLHSSVLPKQRTMGHILSSLLGGGAMAAAAESSGTSRVTAFHSSNSWQLHLNSSLHLNKLMVVEFTATWSGPCNLMAPIFEGMAAKYTDVEFVKIDVDELSDVSREFKVQVMPTFMLLKQGKEVGRVVGAKKDELEHKIIKHM